MPARPDVHLLAGLNGSGKTTCARRLERELPAVRFTLDEWMLRLHRLRYDHPDYPDAAAHCRELIWDIAKQVLSAGVPVVLDWNLWSRARRSEWVSRAADAGAGAVLHYLDVSLDTAIERVASRVDPHAHALTPTGIRHLQSIFEPPTRTEGFRLHLVDPSR